MSMRAAVVSEQSESKTTEKKRKKFGLEQFSSYENNNSSRTRTRTRTQQVSLQNYYSSSATAPDTTHSKTVEEEQQGQGQEEQEEFDEGLKVPVQAASCSPVDSLQVILPILGSSLQFCWIFFLWLDLNRILVLDAKKAIPDLFGGENGVDEREEEGVKCYCVWWTSLLTPCLP
jgi:hypothetical protein